MRRHGPRVTVIWLVVTVILELIIGKLPIPSPVGSNEALGEHQTVYMLFYVGAPIAAFVWVTFAYNAAVFRRKRGEEAVERPAPPEPTSILLLWAGLSFVIVIFLAGWGTFTLHEITEQPLAPTVYAKVTHVHGHTRKAVALAQPKVLDVQVIGQQWYWTFRYPAFGGVETKDLYIPVDVPIHFHVTSLDVVHSFWIFDYDVKEDAVPGVENTAWMLARNTSSYTDQGSDWVKCNELCGIGHGYMKSKLFVVTQAKFKTWATQQENYERSTGLLKNLPAYAPVYYPASNSNWPPPPQDQSP
jgi:cytochrome c oxidase subunit 2